MNKNIIKVTEGPTLRNDIPVVVGAITVATLIEKGHIPEYDPKSKIGYQRAPMQKRITQLANAITSGQVDLPTALLLNIMEKKEDVIERDRGNTFLNLSNVDSIHVVDGQHRFLALKKALEEKSDISNYKIPFVGMLGADQYKEMEQFYVVNSTSRAVPTSLALALLRDRAKHDSDFHKYLVRGGLVWKSIGQDIVDSLAKNSPIWKGRIQLANAKKGITSIPSTAMITSFRSIIKGSRFFRQASTDQKIQLVNAYWEGIKLLVPEAFITGKLKGKNGFEKYSIQKGVGVLALHGIYSDALGLVLNKGKSPYRSDSFEEILHDPIMGIEGINGDDEVVRGDEFWLTGKNGGLGIYSSGSAIQRLIDRLSDLLPEHEVDSPD